jgi:hypothetical protein
MTDKEQNTAPQTTANQAAEGQAVQPRYKGKAIGFTHWVVNYIGIGWVLNAILSVEIYNWLKKNTQVEQKTTDGLAKAVTATVKMFKQQSPEAIQLTKAMSGSFMYVALLGIGGFAVLPLQKLYGAYRHKLAHYGLLAKDYLSGHKPHTDGPPPKAPAAERESLPHWFVGKLVGFTSACTAYLLLEYKYPHIQPAVTRGITKQLQRVWSSVRETQVEHYFVEQYAAVISVGMLATVKPLLDKFFPPKPPREKHHSTPNTNVVRYDDASEPEISSGNQIARAENVQKRILTDGPKSLREYAARDASQPSATL